MVQDMTKLTMTD